MSGWDNNDSAGDWGNGTSANANAFGSAVDDGNLNHKLNGNFDSGNAGGGSCRICNETGHFARECPQKPASFGKCFNCGEEGLVLQENLPSWLQRFVSVGILYANKRSDIVRPNVPNLVFSLGLVVSVRKKGMQLVTVRISRLLFVTIASKKNNKAFDLSSIETLSIEDAWDKLIKAGIEAVETRDLDEFREAVNVYHKAVPELSYLELERALRTNEIAIYLIATDKRMMDTQTLVNLAGKLDCRYQVGYYFKKTPRSAMMAESWPANDEENHERLKDAGVPIDRGIPKCLRCKEMGHTSKSCSEEVAATEKIVVKCLNCEEEGHRVRDCPKVRPDRFACRKCK
ncbi:MAG: hypothetical protein Q9190_001355 [Brigantiaea leucoxantha]